MWATHSTRLRAAIFAIERGFDEGRPPRLGLVTDIVKRQNKVQVRYTIDPATPFISAEALESWGFDLDISKWELTRTHWAVKDINLPKELRSKGVILPPWVHDVSNAVDISTHVFDVALSFPGEVRPVVEAVAVELERRMGPNSYFYDTTMSRNSRGRRWMSCCSRSTAPPHR